VPPPALLVGVETFEEEGGGEFGEEDEGGGFVEPVPDPTVTVELPLLWYPSVATIW